MLPEVLLRFFHNLFDNTTYNNLQVNQCVVPFKCSVLNGWNLISPQINFKKIGEIAEHAIRFYPRDLIVVQNPVIEKDTKECYNVPSTIEMLRCLFTVRWCKEEVHAGFPLVLYLNNQQWFLCKNTPLDRMDHLRRDWFPANCAPSHDL